MNSVHETTAAAGDADHEVVFAGHDAAHARRDVAGRQAGHVVRAVDLVDREALEQAVGHHRRRAAAVLFGRLEDEAHGAVEIALLREQLCCAEQHRHVAVVPAGVHAAGVQRRVGAALGGLGEGEGIHVGAQADRAAAVAGFQRADHAGATDAALHLDAQQLEHAGDVVGGAALVEAGLGVAVQVVAPALQLRLELGGGHGGAPARNGCVLHLTRPAGRECAIRSLDDSRT